MLLQKHCGAHVPGFSEVNQTLNSEELQELLITLNLPGIAPAPSPFLGDEEPGH